MAELLPNDRFPLSHKYDRDWMLRNQTGPNALWLMEWLKLQEGAFETWQSAEY